MSNDTAMAPLLSALAELKTAVLALNPPKSYAEMLAQYNCVGLALDHAKAEHAALENASRQIFSLPPEITSHIFRIGRDMHDPKNGDNVLPSLRASHVSRAWRAVALGTPALWTTCNSLPPRSPQFYEMLVQRSQVLLLDFHIRAKDGSDDSIRSASDLMVVALSVPHRWRIMNIVAPYEFVRSAIPKLRDLSTPSLEQLQIADNITSETPYFINSLDSPAILSGGAPILSTFSSFNIGWHACLPPFAALTALSFGAVFPISYPALCDALNAAPATLTRLVLCLSLIDRTGPIRCITMPSLIKMELDTPAGYADHMFLMLATISAPSIVGITIIAENAPRWEECVSLFESVGPTPRYPTLQLLEVSGELGGGILAPFQDIKFLVIVEREARVTHVGDLFDPAQRGFATFAPGLLAVVAPALFQEDVYAFGAARREAGLRRPLFKMQDGGFS